MKKADQEDTAKKTEIETTSTTKTVIKETKKVKDPEPEEMTREDLLKELEKISSGKSCFWSDQAKEVWLKRLQTRAIALSTVEIIRKVEDLMEKKD